MSGDAPDLIAALDDLRVALTAERRIDLLDPVGLVDDYAPVDTPIGSGLVAFSRHGPTLLRVDVTERQFAEEFRRRFGARPLRQAERPPAGMAAALRSGRVRNLPVDLRALTPFQRDVLDATREIPAGEVRPYGWVAARIGRHAAVRAVANALASNPLPLVVPCHRVVRADGRAGGYIFGTGRKRALLAAEDANLDEVADVHRRGYRYVASATTGVFCHPSCHNARRIREPNRVLLRDETQAADRGYRPCHSCRPAPASSADS